ncbi:hypothetical protein CXB51_020170 [Gossypium anomalum]|uniref:Uncharacterized protein n=1 Tax=Gossypium anomalum TaxID=47600 RepID=A0A8J5Z1I6_9ROSI|nr:hypothetical protein CXB51_020170 [Gossypium anomalum]
MSLSARSGLRPIAHLSPRCSLASLRYDGSQIIFVSLNLQAIKQSRALKAHYMWFGSKVKVPEPADSSILTHYMFIRTEFDSGEYISLRLYGDENLTKTQVRMYLENDPLSYTEVKTSRRSSFSLPLKRVKLTGNAMRYAKIHQRITLLKAAYYEESHKSNRQHVMHKSGQLRHGSALYGGRRPINPPFLTDFWSPSSIKHRSKAKTPRTWSKLAEQPRNACFFSFSDLTRMENGHQQGGCQTRGGAVTYGEGFADVRGARGAAEGGVQRWSKGKRLGFLPFFLCWKMFSGLGLIWV